MLSMLRAQVNEVLLTIPVRRRPALRRSDAPDALLATDLPLVAEPEAVDAFAEKMEALGWRVWQAPNGWLLLDVSFPAPDASVPRSPVGACGCCISLLERHPEPGNPTEMIRAVVKAADTGIQPFERLCQQLHAQLAAMLRLRAPLPAALLPYLCCAYHELYDRRMEK